MVLESSLPLITVDRISLTVGLRKTRAGKVLSPGTHLFDDLSWSLSAGHHCAIVGPSGSGKTSFLRLLNRLISPTTGTIAWQGQPYEKIPIGVLRRDILYVSQTPKLLGMTVADAIAYPLRLRQLPEDHIQTRVGEICDRLEIPIQWLDQTELQLSQGSQQWVSLARALIIEPQVLLLDEPTAALDLAQKHRLTHVLKALQGTSLTIASHDHEWVNTLTPNHLMLASATRQPYQHNGDDDW